MNTYHKIQSVFLRDPETNMKKLDFGKWAKPEFEYLANQNWYWTEKIDGTNIRVIFDGETVEFKGKSDNAEIPKPLLKKLAETFTLEKMKSNFINLCETYGGVCLYGEGYGKKIQKGHHYISDDVSFILFDVKVGFFWLERDNLYDIAGKLDIPIVPIMGAGSLSDAIALASMGFKSTIAENKDYDAEGLICFPTCQLFNRHGDRVITKIKTRDF